jgi:hypothetical protein
MGASLMGQIINVQEIQVGKPEGHHIKFKKCHCQVDISYFVFGTFTGSSTVRRLAIVHEDFYSFPQKIGGWGWRGKYAELDQALSLSLFHSLSNPIFSKCRALRHFVYCILALLTTVDMETTVWWVMQCT